MYKDKPVKHSKAVQDSNFNIFEYIDKNQWKCVHKEHLMYSSSNSTNVDLLQFPE